MNNELLFQPFRTVSPKQVCCYMCYVSEMRYSGLGLKEKNVRSRSRDFPSSAGTRHGSSHSVTHIYITFCTTDDLLKIMTFFVLASHDDVLLLSTPLESTLRIIQ